MSVDECLEAYEYANALLRNRYGEPADPIDFYRDMYHPDNYIASYSERKIPYAEYRVKGEFKKPAVRMTVMPDGSNTVRNNDGENPWSCYSEMDGLKAALNLGNELPNSKITIPPCSYAGHSAKQVYAVWLHACVIDIDTVLPHNLDALLDNIESGLIPRPTWLATSGSGIHAYFIFDNPVYLKGEVSLEELNAIKRSLICQLWTPDTSSKGSAEYQPVVQGIRAVGTRTKQGKFVNVYRTGDVISLDQYRSFDIGYLETPPYKTWVERKRAELESKELEDKAVADGKRKYTKGKLINHSRPVYDDFRSKVTDQAEVGKRYSCMRVMAILAAQCGMDKDELSADLHTVATLLNKKSENKVTGKDIEQAMSEFADPNVRHHTYSYLESLSGIEILRMPKPEFQSRPDHAYLVSEWQDKNPYGRKSECARELGICEGTVRKYWNDEKALLVVRSKLKKIRNKYVKRKKKRS